MARHNDFGKKGEDLAAAWLTEQGFEILSRNWRSGRCEIDCIALRDNIYHFVEVKALATHLYGYPEEKISKKKIRNIMHGAASWLYERRIPATVRIQYDVLAITLHDNGTPEYFFATDVYA